DLLISAKSQLDDTSPAVRPTLVKNLHRVASLAESFTEQRPRDCAELADGLDQEGAFFPFCWHIIYKSIEGVNLWNISSLVRKCPEDDGRAVVAALRLAAFRLVEAGLEPKPGIESYPLLALLHVLQMASKTGATLSELGNIDIAGSVLTSAAKFEELLRNAPDPDGTHRQARARAIVVYFSSRMEAAWKEGNHTVADFMASKITGVNNDSLPLVHINYQRTLLATKFHGIGKAILKSHATSDNNGTKPADAVVWLQKAFTMADQLDDSAVSGVPQLKVTVAAQEAYAARAYFLSGSYDRAEATLDELVPSIDSSDDPASSEYQELRWLRLAILKRRKAGDPALLDAFKSIIDHMELTESRITDVLQDLRTISHQHALVTAVNQHCLKRALAYPDRSCGHVDRLLLSLIVHCSKDEDHARAMAAIDSTFTSICEADYELPSVPATACLTLLWQYGDRHYHAKRWSDAADWFIAGSHKLFRENCPTSNSKCHRKAALCYIEHREYAKASAVIRRCPITEAATHYVIFLTAVHQGIDDEAIRAVQDMMKSQDFDRKMLLLATQISHESENRRILLAALEALLKTLKLSKGGETVLEAMSLLRCIIKLVLRLLTEPAADKPILIGTMVEHFQTAKILIEAANAQKALNLITKDVSWLWRTAFNCAVQGCSEWEGSGCEERISDLFDIARDLLETCCQASSASPVDVDAEVYLHLIIASFSGVSGRSEPFPFYFSVFSPLSGPGTRDKKARIRDISSEINTCRERVEEIQGKGVITDENDLVRVGYFLHTLRVFEVEMLVRLGEWEAVGRVVGDTVKAGPLAASTYEAIADILWVRKDCPINSTKTNQSILRASLDHNSLSIDKFSRWLRALCTIMIARNDRLKAVGYVEQAVGVIEGSVGSDEPYPMDERFWLLSTAYNVGFECLESSAFDEAKRWFESSTVICRYVPGGKERAEKVCF
ncbi:SPO22-domain-containing protein, partial [Armillaria gallica]